MAQRKIRAVSFRFGKKHKDVLYALSKSGRIYRLNTRVTPKQVPRLKERILEAQFLNNGQFTITLSHWTKVASLPSCPSALSTLRRISRAPTTRVAATERDGDLADMSDEAFYGHFDELTATYYDLNGR